MPFGELRKMQNRSLVEDYGIGLGLSNSKEMARHIGGDVILLSSNEQETLFQVTIPVDIQSNQIIFNSP